MRHPEKAKAELLAEIADLRQLVTELKSTIHYMEGEAAHFYMTPQMLRESEQQYRALVEEAIQGVSIVVGYTRVYANLTLAKMLGYDRPKELIGMHVWDNIVLRSLEEIRRLGEARRRGETTPEWYTYQRRKKDGTPIWVEQRVVPIAWEGHDAYLVTMIDVSDRKQMEEALQHAYQTLEDRVEARTAELKLANLRLQEEIIRRQKVEHALRQSHAHFNALLDHNADIIETVVRTPG